MASRKPNKTDDFKNHSRFTLTEGIIIMSA
jgi:hypothetical protein